MSNLTYTHISQRFYKFFFYYTILLFYSLYILLRQGLISYVAQTGLKQAVFLALFPFLVFNFVCLLS